MSRATKVLSSRTAYPKQSCAQTWLLPFLLPLSSTLRRSYSDHGSSYGKKVKCSWPVKNWNYLWGSLERTTEKRCEAKSFTFLDVTKLSSDCRAHEHRWSIWEWAKMFPEARAMDVCRDLLLSPYCLCEEEGPELRGELRYTDVWTRKGKSNLPKTETTSHLHTAWRSSCLEK